MHRLSKSDSSTMPRLSTPWFHQKNSTPQSSPPSELSTPVMDEEDIDALTQRLMKPTRASQAKESLHLKMETYMDRGRHAWTKMPLCEDNKKCLWTPHGTVKKTYQT